MERIVVFIDNSNIFKGFRKYNMKVDYELLKKVIVGDRKLKEIYLYEGVVYPISSEKKKWYEELSNRSGYVIKTSFDKIATSGAIEKKVDINIAIDIISFAYEDIYDTAVLVSGDGDFVPIVKKVKELNKNVEIWAFKYSLANALRDSLEPINIHYLDDILSEIRM
ncbi:MAG: NYN domain-containing protein [Promethearchaeota archaeon]